MTNSFPIGMGVDRLDSTSHQAQILSSSVMRQRSESDQNSKLVGVAWLLLLINTLGYAYDLNLLFEFPQFVAQLATMGSLMTAFGLALVLNPRVRIRSNPYLALLTVLLAVSFIASVDPSDSLGSLFRCLRFAVFIATLWLLSYWWRGDLAFVRYTIHALVVFVLSVAVGLAASPQDAMWGTQGRLVGVVWPMHAPKVGQYAAVLAGLVVLLWLTKLAKRWSAVALLSLAIPVLLLSHTRTATVALIAALACAMLALVAASGRARRALAAAITLAGISAVVFGQTLQNWFARGQDPELLMSLTGRQANWNALLEEERTLYETALGTGLSNKSFNGIPIDSSWLAIYLEQGLIGLSVVILIIAVVFFGAVIRSPSPARACAVFLIIFCVVSSYTEVGLGDASTYLLYLAVAASLVVSNAEPNGLTELAYARRAGRGDER